MTAHQRPTSNKSSEVIGVPGHPGRWRLVSLIAVALAAIIVTTSIVQDRRSADRQPPSDSALMSVEVRASGSALAASNVHSSAHRMWPDTTGPTIDPSTGTALVPVTSLGHSLVAATTTANQITGFAINDPSNSGAVIDEHSTAKALLVLSPALLRQDLDTSIRIASRIDGDPMQAALVSALGSNPRLVASNVALGGALAALLDRVPFPAPEPDQGCDSIASTRAYPVAGTCVQPAGEATTIHNEQDRWVLVFSESNDWSEVCAAVPPARERTASHTISSSDCGTRVLLAAPGQLPANKEQFTAISDDTLADRRDVAAALTLLDTYVLPYAALTAGVDGYASHLAVNPASVPVIVRELSQLMASDQLALDAIRNAYDPTSTPAVRQHAAAQAAYSMLSTDTLMSALPAEIGQRSDALALLDFYRVVAAAMSSDRSAPTWTAAAAGVIDGL